jgi:murein L,D-transpeptidase YcbB/YkuD
MRKMLQVWVSVIVFAFIFSLQTIEVKANELVFQENASEIIFNSLQTQPDHSFLKKLYKEVLFMPVWMREKSLSPAAKELFETIRDDGTLNKKGTLYQDNLLLEQRAEEIYAFNGSMAEKLTLEFKISQLYKAYTDYAYFGSINWGAFQARISNLMVNGVSTEWVLHRPEVNPIGIVEKAALGESLKKQLQAAVPTAYHYKKLQKALERYMDIRENGGWEQVLLFKKLKPGKRAKGVVSLRNRLLVTKDYIPCEESGEDTLYDACLQKAVKHFQLRNGLKPDGVVGSVTLRELNRSVDERITTIRLNLDRLKWLNERASKRHIIINIPDFKLYFEEDGKLIQTMRVVTGKPNHPTPIFSDTVEYIVLNPYWNIPKSIIQKEMIPKLLKNPNAMARQGIEIHSGWGKDAEKISAASVDWSQYRYSKHMPYRFAQVPGTRNALGKVKFLFPNKFSVYMHDTPSKHLFKRSKRAFSHGCIRLQKPRELLRTFSTFNSNIDFEKSQKILKGRKKTYINLQEKVPVDVIYLTAWVDYDGKLQFRNDVYHYDKMQLKSFRKW